MDEARNGLQAGLERLTSILRQIGPSVVAFSGGIDSTFLLRAAHDALGEAVVAVTAVSPSLAAAERLETRRLAEIIGAPHRFIDSREMDDPDYLKNDGRRCYFCKRELFRVLRTLRPLLGERALLYGAIVDDRQDDRPGMTAASEAGARAPLLEAGFTKAMVREASRGLGLPNWDKPAMACLASRIPRFTPVTEEALRLVDRAETALRRLGYRQVRVRHQGGAARVEIDPADLPRASESPERERILDAVRQAGYREALLDPEGYRPGGRAAAPASARG